MLPLHPFIHTHPEEVPIHGLTLIDDLKLLSFKKAQLFLNGSLIVHLIKENLTWKNSFLTALSIFSGLQLAQISPEIFAQAPVYANVQLAPQPELVKTVPSAKPKIRSKLKAKAKPKTKTNTQTPIKTSSTQDTKPPNIDRILTKKRAPKAKRIIPMTSGAPRDLDTPQQPEPESQPHYIAVTKSNKGASPIKGFQDVPSSPSRSRTGLSTTPSKYDFSTATTGATKVTGKNRLAPLPTLPRETPVEHPLINHKIRTSSPPSQPKLTPPSKKAQRGYQYGELEPCIDAERDDLVREIIRAAARAQQKDLCDCDDSTYDFTIFNDFTTFSMVVYPKNRKIEGLCEELQRALTCIETRP